MKLPTDYQMTSLSDLKRVVGSTVVPNMFYESLEMTKEQYLRYKELVWREDPIRFYNGMEIKLSTEEPSKTGDGSV